jgi:hypothetical protein
VHEGLLRDEGGFSFSNNMPVLKLRKNIVEAPAFFSLRRRLIYVSLSGMMGVFFLVKLAVVPLVARGYTVPVAPLAPLAVPGPATATMIADLHAQNMSADSLRYATHPYLTGRGTLVGLAGDNLQIFEYPTGEMARKEASMIFTRAPRLATESFFHLYLRDNLIGLYFGHNAAVIQAAEQEMGAPL